MWPLGGNYLDCVLRIGSAAFVKWGTADGVKLLKSAKGAYLRGGCFYLLGIGTGFVSLVKGGLLRLAGSVFNRIGV